MRKRAKVDETHSEIVAAFRQAGWLVLSLASLGNGAPDLLVADRGCPEDLYLVEVKGAKGKVRASQGEFAKRWQVHVIRSVPEVMDFIGAMDGYYRLAGRS